MDDNYTRLMQFQIARARDYFDKSEDGISKLHPSARMCAHSTHSLPIAPPHIQIRIERLSTQARTR
jgi:phytoene/squalene synthetase